jgi:hypothetical protein
MNKSDYIDAEGSLYNGERLIEIVLRDKVTGEILGTRLIKRAALAKAFLPLSDNQVVGAYKGLFVMEV